MKLVEAPYSSSTAMVSDEFQRAAQWRGVIPARSRLFTSAPLPRSNRTTSSLLLIAAHMSAVLPSSSAIISTGTPAYKHSSTELMSPSHTAEVKLWTYCLSITMEEIVKSKQFDVCETHFYHSLCSINCFRSNVGASRNKTVSGRNNVVCMGNLQLF